MAVVRICNGTSLIPYVKQVVTYEKFVTFCRKREFHFVVIVAWDIVVFWVWKCALQYARTYILEKNSTFAVVLKIDKVCCSQSLIPVYKTTRCHNQSQSMFRHSMYATAVPLATRSNEWFCSHLIVGTAGSNPARATMFLLWVLYIVRHSLLCRADPWSRGVLPGVVCLSAIVKPRLWGVLGPLGVEAP